MASLSTKFTSFSQEWETPDNLFQALHARYRFTLDVCATSNNAKCAQFFSHGDDGLSQSWRSWRAWMNPPFATVGQWVAKAHTEVQAGTPLVVGLLPARTNTRWFQDDILHARVDVELHFLPTRIRFKGAMHPLPQPLVIVAWTPSATPHVAILSSLGLPT